MLEEKIVIQLSRLYHTVYTSKQKAMSTLNMFSYYNEGILCDPPQMKGENQNKTT